MKRFAKHSHDLRDLHISFSVYRSSITPLSCEITKKKVMQFTQSLIFLKPLVLDAFMSLDFPLKELVKWKPLLGDQTNNSNFKLNETKV